MFKILAAMYITGFTAYALADKGFVLAASIAVFIGVPMALGYVVGKGE